MVAVATITLSGLLLVSALNNNQQAFAGEITTTTSCEYVFLPTDPVEINIVKTANERFKIKMVDTDTLDCIRTISIPGEPPLETPIVRELSIFIDKTVNRNGAQVGNPSISVVTCDIDLPGTVPKPTCTSATPTTSITATTCVPGKGNSFIESASEWFEFTTSGGTKMIKTLTVTLQKEILGCEPDANGKPTKFYEVFNIIEMFENPSKFKHHVIVCVNDFEAGTISACQDFGEANL